jgi:tetratricopeptide (TPR) repeat protein
VTDGDWQALLAQASADRRAGRVDEAIAAYKRLLESNPDLPDSWYNLGWLQRQARQFDDALRSYAEALGRGVDGAEEVHLNRAVIFADHLAQPEQAEAELRQALKADPAYLPALLNLGNLAEDLGKREEAQAAYRRALKVDPANPLALARLANASPADADLAGQLRAALERSDLLPSERADLGFSLTRLLDLAGAYGQAFDAAAAANRASRDSFGPSFRGYRREEAEALIDRIIAVFDKPVGAAPDDGRQLLFVCGMFRSGSTLAEQMLASHSQVQAGGELDLLPEMIVRELQPYPEAAERLTENRIAELRRTYLEGLDQRGLTGPVVTDKRPDNFLQIGLIKTLFPAARIIHTRRAALDNLLSLYFLHLAPEIAYALDLGDAAHWLEQHDRLMAHWRALYPDDIFELDYDALVADPRPTIEALLDFCGLDWEDGVLDFHAAANPVKTASVWQVRQPLHGRSSGRWHNYAKQLGPLADALRRP